MRRDEEDKEDLNDTTRRNNTSQADAVETLEIERTRALTSLRHLVRSNEELEVELAREDGEEDADGDKAAYASAIEENKRAIANVQERIYALSREISQITGADVRLGGDDANAQVVDGGNEGGAWV